MLYLQPLLQKKLSDRLDISPSVISRILSSKYIETPHGIFPLKTLCPRSYFGKTEIRFQRLIGDLCRKFPNYSDALLAKYMIDELDIKIARRTVSKYRLKLGIASSQDKRN